MERTMSRKGATVLAGLALGGLLWACSGSSQVPEMPEDELPQNPVLLRTPGSNLNVKVTLTSATLGDDCGGTDAPNAAADKSAAGISADCAPTKDDAGVEHGCGSARLACQGSNLQLYYEVDGQGLTARAEVTAVRLLQADTTAVLTTLTASTPQAWMGSQYQPWDGTLTTGARLRASYALSSPNWSQLGGGNSWNSYQHRYILEVDVRVDGVKRTLRSEELSRDPLVAT